MAGRSGRPFLYDLFLKSCHRFSHFVAKFDSTMFPTLILVFDIFVLCYYHRHRLIYNDDDECRHNLVISVIYTSKYFFFQELEQPFIFS